MITLDTPGASVISRTPVAALQGVHHTARPTWRLRETVEFYRDKLGLPLVHAVSARAWGPPDHTDFLHFFFDAGRGATIAFFYYIGAEQPDWVLPRRDFRYGATHTAWAVESVDDLQAWKDRLDAQGIPLRVRTRHEIIDSIYFADPNGYPVEITWQLRPMTAADALDAEHTMQAAMSCEDALREGAAFSAIDDVWRLKGEAISAGARKDHGELFVLDVPEFLPLISGARDSAGCLVHEPEGGYWRVSIVDEAKFLRRELGLRPAVWWGALTGGCRNVRITQTMDEMTVSRALAEVGEVAA